MLCKMLHQLVQPSCFDRRRVETTTTTESCSKPDGPGSVKQAPSVIPGADWMYAVNCGRIQLGAANVQKIVDAAGDEQLLFSS